ncbi:MAG: alpha/beta hydrolase [Sphingopyxis sp.]|uniref:alpha/beta hydrolase n=1 Tax=Sphingopyxis sp. TaxID=1908224 RepID=UPI002AB99854|nr:alpha/beta hydrolase [Sphingopyxis sp.]MDZ3830579.1 alpha/beta hydrolase [Sphingopyxis sp.]
MVSPAALFRMLTVALLAAVLAFAPARAQQFVTITTTTTVTTTVWTIEDDGAGAGITPRIDDDGQAIEIADPDDADRTATRRYAGMSALPAPVAALARFGPFSVVDARTARMEGDVDSATPRQFAAMLAAFPALKRLEMIDCPGSLDEAANLILARAIRRAGLETSVPSGGSVRSGAVELWLAGTRRSAAADAEFGVHSWADEYGREAQDYPANDPVHAEYLSYYREMGMDEPTARAFYAMTNSTPFDQVRYLTRDDMARFVALN